MDAFALNEIAKRWFEAFNNQDIEKLLALYHDQATHFSPKLKLRHPESNGLIIGKEAMRWWWQDSFKRLPSLKYEIVRLTLCDDRVFMEYIRHVNNEVDLYVGEMLEMHEGRIIKSSVFHQ